MKIEITEGLGPAGLPYDWKGDASIVFVATPKGRVDVVVRSVVCGNSPMTLRQAKSVVKELHTFANLLEERCRAMDPRYDLIPDLKTNSSVVVEEGR